MSDYSFSNSSQGSVPFDPSRNEVVTGGQCYLKTARVHLTNEKKTGCHRVFDLAGKHTRYSRRDTSKKENSELLL